MSGSVADTVCVPLVYSVHTVNLSLFASVFSLAARIALPERGEVWKFWRTNTRRSHLQVVANKNSV